MEDKSIELLKIFTSLQSGNTGQGQEIDNIDKLIKEFYNSAEMEMKANISKKQVVVFALAYLYEDIFNTGVLEKFIKQYLKLTVSVDGAGRKEFEAIFKTGNDISIVPEMVKKSRFWGE